MQNGLAGHHLELDVVDAVDHVLGEEQLAADGVAAARPRIDKIWLGEWELIEGSGAPWRKETRLALLAGPAVGVHDGHREAAVERNNVDLMNHDHAVQPAGQRALHEKLRRRRQLIAVGHEGQLADPASEIGAVDAFSRGREQDLVDQVADVVVAIGLGRAAAAVDLEREVEEGFWSWRHQTSTRCADPDTCVGDVDDERPARSPGVCPDHAFGDRDREFLTGQRVLHRAERGTSPISLVDRLGHAVAGQSAFGSTFPTRSLTAVVPASPSSRSDPASAA